MHHKPKTQVDSYGTEIRLRRKKKASRPCLTKGTRKGYDGQLPNPNPDGAPPTEAWVLTRYPTERHRRQVGAALKRYERRAALKKQERLALDEPA